MRGSYRTARIVETRNLFLARLRHRVWTIQQENCDLLVGLLSDIHRPMNAVTRLSQSACPGAMATRSLSPPSRYSIERRSPRITIATL